ncbi:unnamed protein product [Phytomonas sp. EM1]|nr:unnamed protein product [Phytomonas sp. EM1]|eukprot:CCW60872.1 unnamed protein product [Phytomonas sp. isolate EM1]
MREEKRRVRAREDAAERNGKEREGDRARSAGKTTPAPHLLSDSFTTASTTSAEAEGGGSESSANTSFDREGGFTDFRAWRRYEDGAAMIGNSIRAFPTASAASSSSLPPPFSFFPALLDTKDEIWDSLITSFLENVVLRQGKELNPGSGARAAPYFPLYECTDELRCASTLPLSAVQQQRLLELLTTADYLGDALLTRSCSRYFVSWLMQASEHDLLASFTPARGEIARPTAFGEDFTAKDRKSEAKGVKATYDSTAETSVHIEDFSTRKDPCGGAENRCDRLCLSAEQRLALLAEVNRTNAMFLEPYC